MNSRFLVIICVTVMAFTLTGCESSQFGNFQNFFSWNKSTINKPPMDETREAQNQVVEENGYSPIKRAEGDQPWLRENPDRYAEEMARNNSIEPTEPRRMIDSSLLEAEEREQAYTAFGKTDTKLAEQEAPPAKREPQFAIRTSDDTEKTCPDAVIVPELQTLYTFSPEDSQSSSDMVATVWIGAIDARCREIDGEKFLSMQIIFDALAGPKGKRSDTDGDGDLDDLILNYPYFVAITSNKGTILIKDVYDVPMRFKSGELHARKIMRINQRLPALIAARGVVNEALVGFQMNSDQLDYSKTQAP